MTRKFWLFLLSLFLFGSAASPLHADTHRIIEEENQKRNDGPIYAFAGTMPQVVGRGQSLRINRHTNLGPREKWMEDLKNMPEDHAAIYRIARGYYSYSDSDTGPDPDSLNSKLMNDLGYLSDAHPDSTQLKTALDKYKSDLKSDDLNTRFKLGKRFMEAGKTNKNFYIGALEQFEWIAVKFTTKLTFKDKIQVHKELENIFNSSNDENIKNQVKNLEKKLWNLE